MNTWEVPQEFSACFDWTFSSDRTRLLDLYERGKAAQWNASARIDWRQELDPENPQQLPPEALPIHGSPLFARMSPRERIELVRHHQAWTVSQFLHGEQGAMICASKTVQQVPDADAKLYAATQVVDEARHVEVYKKLLEKFGVADPMNAYPMTGGLQTLLGQILRDQRWDMTYLGMQVVIEGLALASFARIRDQAQNPLAAAVNAYVMEDEARHVAFGSLSLRDYYPQLTQPERDEREQFVIEACFLMRERFDAVELWRHLDLPVEECRRHLSTGTGQASARKYLFSRIVPTMHSIGLFGPKLRRAFAAMGVLDLAAADTDTVLANDEQVARDLDARRRHVEAIVAAGRAAKP
jgi:hypothetical protein